MQFDFYSKVIHSSEQYYIKNGNDFLKQTSKNFVKKFILYSQLFILYTVHFILVFSKRKKSRQERTKYPFSIKFAETHTLARIHHGTTQPISIRLPLSENWRKWKKKVVYLKLTDLSPYRLTPHVTWNPIKGDKVKG